MVCVFFGACSLLSKEQGVTVLGVCAGYDVFLNWEVLLRVLTEFCRSKRKRKISGEQVVVNEMILLTESAENKEVASNTNILNGESTPKIVKFNSSSNGKHKTASTNESSDSPPIGTIVGRIGIKAFIDFVTTFFYDLFSYRYPSDSWSSALMV